MLNSKKLITKNIAILTSAIRNNPNVGRSLRSDIDLYGIEKLRSLILDLAIRGFLASQKSDDENVIDSLKRITIEKEKLLAEGLIMNQKLSEISNDEYPFNLPKGWKWIRLGEVAYSQAGFAFASKHFNDSKNGIPLIRIRDVGQEFSGTFYDGDFKQEYIVNDGDYLISMDGIFRVAKWNNGKAILNQRVSRLIFFGNETSDKFIAISLQLRLRELQGVKSYTTVDHLSGKQISNALIPYPPLAEQSRIIAKVDKIMDILDQLEKESKNRLKTHEALVSTLLLELTSTKSDTSNFESIWEIIQAKFDKLFSTQKSIDQLKYTILKLALMGKLVSQDPKDEPACKLLKQIANAKAKLIKEKKIKEQKPLPKISKKEEPYSLPYNWEWIRLGDATNYGITKKIEASEVEKEIWVLELEDIEKITSKLLKKVRFNERRFKSSKNIFNKSDVIYGKLRPYLDKVVIADEPGVCTTEMIPLRGYADILPEYLRWVMKSPYFIEYANNSTHGMNLPRMGTEKARLALIPLPPKEEQYRIVAKVDELMALCDQLKSSLATAQTTQLKLADSIVEKAIV